MNKETICGVEMPEPDLEHACYRPGKRLQGTEEFAYTAEQLRQTVAAAVARKDAEIDALYKHGFQIQDERDALRAEVDRQQAAALTNTQIDAPLAEERRRQALEAASKGENK